MVAERQIDADRQMNSESQINDSLIDTERSGLKNNPLLSEFILCTIAVIL